MMVLLRPVRMCPSWSTDLQVMREKVANGVSRLDFSSLITIFCKLWPEDTHDSHKTEVILSTYTCVTALDYFATSYRARWEQSDMVQRSSILFLYPLLLSGSQGACCQSPAVTVREARHTLDRTRVFKGGLPQKFKPWFGAWQMGMFTVTLTRSLPQKSVIQKSNL